jgi:hypothetical protein
LTLELDMAKASREEVLEAYQRHVALRAAGDWAGMASLFAEDGRYYDPLFGWQEGREAIGRFLEGAMAGLVERTFTDVWHIVDGDRLVIYWQCTTPGPAEAAAGLYHGMSALRYAGGGLWAEQMDIYDREEATSSRASARLEDSSSTT